MDERARALEELYRTRYRRFRDAVETITGPESAWDAVQETFARALRRRHTFRGEGSLEAWVWKIAIRTAQEQRSKPRALSLNGTVETVLAEPERDPALAEALRALPARRRLIVFLRYFADLSYGEIAEVCGVSEGTVGAALAQARASLGKALADEEGGRGRA